MKLFLSVCAAILLSGCSLMHSMIGVSPSEIDTTNKALAASAAQLTITYNLTTDLLESGVITASQASKVKSALDPALDIVKNIQATVERTGDPSGAANAIETATVALQIAMNLLTEFAPTQTAYIHERLNHGSDYCRSFERLPRSVSSIEQRHFRPACGS
jgi:hypothetical protein